MSFNETDDPKDDEVEETEKPNGNKSKKTERIGQDNEEEAEFTIFDTPDEG